jgi:MoxR-like ATPase
MTTIDPAQLSASTARFRAFFQEIGGAFMERDDVLAQLALALLAKEHALIAGPPGTAKSQIASAVLGRVVCEEKRTPSLFARQITESTVHTDLVGPIDFKNLTETGRTTHFTDEGMLGAVHAFLDEVFDGRDMLLRSALNVLQERELKQGGVITKGRIECAVMTSNRYISEVLDQSRDTLLAFVDRIAFIGFVPRSFADPENLRTVLRSRVGGTGGARLDALLTIQDVDVLQAAAADVYVSPEICDGLATLLGSLDREMAAAQRADPAFSPTRYISTRTAVRCGAILRAAVIHDMIFRDPERELEAQVRDLAALRFHVLLSGPSPRDIERLLASEVDPVERRQLTIMRTEREIFDACIAKLPTITPSKRPVVRRVPVHAPGPKPPPPEGKNVEPTAVRERRLELERLGRKVRDAEQATDLGTLVATARDVAELAREGEPLREQGRELLERALAAVETTGLRTATLATDPRAPVVESVTKVVELAELLEDGRASSHETASFMRRRAAKMIEDAIAFGGAGSAIASALGDEPQDPSDLTRARLATLSRLIELRRRLFSRTSAPSDPTADEDVARALGRAEHELAAIWAGAFARAFEREAGDSGSRALEGVLGALKPELARLAEIDQELSKAAGRPTRVTGLVAAPRVGSLVKKALLAARPGDRTAFVRQVASLLSTLAQYDLRGAVDVGAWLSHAAEALTRAEPDAPPVAQAGASRKGFVAMRAAEQRVPVACTLAEVALAVAPDLAGTESPPMERVAAVIEALPFEIKTEIARVDLARLGRAVDYLERWWTELEGGPPEALAKSQLLEVLWEDQALARFSVEARLLEEILPAARDGAKELRGRLERLNERAHAASVAVLEQRADADWRRANQSA